MAFSMLQAGLWAMLAAATLLVGAYLAVRFTVPSSVVGRIMGFGAGALVAALAYERATAPPRCSPRSASRWPPASPRSTDLPRRRAANLEDATRPLTACRVHTLR
jgi:hypothetical protein